jgi:hypothetical protein
MVSCSGDTTLIDPCQWLWQEFRVAVARPTLSRELRALGDLANFLLTEALPEAVKQWSLPTARGRLVKIGAKIVRRTLDHLQMAEALCPRVFQQILELRSSRGVFCAGPLLEDH